MCAGMRVCVHGCVYACILIHIGFPFFKMLQEAFFSADFFFFLFFDISKLAVQ